jgi:hypothetical protein
MPRRGLAPPLLFAGTINELHDLSFDEAALAADLVQVDISSHLLAGINTIQFNPVGRTGSATVSVVVR